MLNSWVRYWVDKLGVTAPERMMTVIEEMNASFEAKEKGTTAILNKLMRVESQLHRAKQKLVRQERVLRNTIRHYENEKANLKAWVNWYAKPKSWLERLLGR